MRRSLSLGLLLVALSALPAAAGHRGGGHGSPTHFAGHFHHFHSFGFSRFSFGFNRFNRFGWGGWGWGDWDGGAGYGGAPGMVIVLPGAQAAAPAPRAAPAQATVATEAGVTVFRGPGSHHLRY